jgi:pantetheine-phosphate adenylyltransferase
MAKIALAPGSFDPITVAHVDIIKRSLDLFDKIIIGIGVNTSKEAFIALEQRKKMLAAVFHNEPKIEIAVYNDLTVNFCKKIGAQYLVRGIRTVSDFEYEKTISHINSVLMPEVETILILSKPHYSSLSSTIVREILKYKGDVSQFVPPEAIPFL